MPNLDTEFWVEVLGIALTAMGLALVSLMEAAMVSVSRVRLRQLTDQGHPTAPLVEQLIARPEELLGTLVVSVNLLVLLAANLTTVAAQRWGTDGVLIANLIVLSFLLIVCEITPKTISVYFAESIALRTARLARLITVLLSPIVRVLTAISTGILRALSALHILSGRVTAVPTAFSEEDIKQLISAGEQSGEVEASEREMIHGVIEFSETITGEIMVPRPDMVSLSSDTELPEAIQTFMTSGHSRLPVYDDSIDNVIGILYVKDILIRLTAAAKGGIPEPTVRELLRPAYFVPESKKTDALLREMQHKRVHLAIVVDEYGGTAGLVTIEDLLEEIVGDIVDEYDTEHHLIERMPDGALLIDGRTSLETIHDTLDVPIPEETEAETISGLVTEILGRIPEVADRLVIGGVEFVVMTVVHNRIDRLRATPLPEDQLAPEAE